MRNLKRALSLALASVMLLGMMVVGTSAASYPDVDENDNVEAIEVLNAVKVMIGDRGNFKPDAPVNRHEMAVIMAKLVLGNEIADNYVGTHPFTDVASWADKYVAACYENGIAAGTSKTTFGGDKPLTAVEAAAFMLRALGYKDLSKGASDWSVPVTAKANELRLFSGVASNPKEQLTRNQVAQLALNTLKSPVVTTTDGTFTATGENGQLILSGGSRKYEVRFSQEAYAYAINDTETTGNSASGIQGATIELGEHLYNGKLKLNNSDIDDFGRPARTWEYDGKTIGTYVKTELLREEYVGGVTGKNLYDLLGTTILDQNSGYGINVFIDGENDSRVNPLVFGRGDMNRNNNAKVGGTGTGTLTQVYVDSNRNTVNRGQVYIAVMNTYLAIADKDYDANKDELSVTAYALKRNGNGEYIKTRDADNKVDDSVTIRLAAEDLPIVKDVKKDDALLITVAQGDVQSAKVAEVLEGVSISAFKLNDSVTSGGTKYSYTTTAEYKNGDLNQYTTADGVSNLKDRTYNIYLDTYGNLIGLKEIEAKKNYVFIAGIDLDNSMLINGTATANAIFLDGTAQNIKVNMTKSTLSTYSGVPNSNYNSILNTWCTYTKNNSDVYTVKEVADVGTSAAPDTDYVPGGAKNLNGTLAQIQVTVAGTGTRTIDPKNMRLPGGPTSTNKYYSVYGDKESVYMTAELGELVKSAPANFGIIKGVESTSVGIANTNLTVWGQTTAVGKANDKNVKGDNPTLATTSNGAYVLYNDKGIVIAAVVVGEDAAAAKDLVYVHSSGLDLEEDNDASGSTRAANDGMWTWSRKVIRNGEEVTLYEVGDDSSELRTMVQYQWYQIRTNASGNVTSAKPANDADVLAQYTGSPVTDRTVFVSEFDKINDAMEETSVDTVLYQQDGGVLGDGKGFGNGVKLSVEQNNTLAVNTEVGSGIHFKDDVNVVLQYWLKNEKKSEVFTGQGYNDLKWAVDEVNEYASKRSNVDSVKNGGTPFYVSALIENGFATTIVIYDAYNPYEAGSSDDPYIGQGYEVSVDDVWNTSDQRALFARYDTIRVLANGTEFNRSIYVPANKTLIIEDDVDLTGVSPAPAPTLTMGTNATLITEGTLTLVNQNFKDGQTVRAKNLTVSNDDDVTYAGTIKVSGNMSVAEKAIISGDVDVKGNLTLSDAVDVTSTGVVSVSGDMSVAKAANIKGTVNVKGDMTLSEDSDFSNTVTVGKALSIANGKKLTNSKGTTTVDSVKAVSGSAAIDVYGTMYVNGKKVAAGDPAVSGVSFNVYSTDSLHITGNVANTVTVTVGNGSAEDKNGRVVIAGKMEGAFVDNNKKATTTETPKQEIKEVAGPTTLKADCQLSTEKFTPSTLNAEVGAQITLTEGIKNSGSDKTVNIDYKDTNGSSLPETDQPTTIVIGGTGASNVTEGGSVDVSEDTKVDTSTYEASAKIGTETVYGTVAELIAKINDSAATEVTTITLQNDSLTNALETGSDNVTKKVAITTGSYKLSLTGVKVRATDGALTIDKLDAGSTLEIEGGAVTVTGNVAEGAVVTVATTATLTVKGDLLAGADVKAELKSVVSVEGTYYQPVIIVASEAVVTPDEISKYVAAIAGTVKEGMFMLDEGMYVDDIKQYFNDKWNNIFWSFDLKSKPKSSTVTIYDGDTIVARTGTKKAGSGSSMATITTTPADNCFEYINDSYFQGSVDGSGGNMKNGTYTYKITDGNMNNDVTATTPGTVTGEVIYQGSFTIDWN